MQNSPKPSPLLQQGFDLRPYNTFGVSARAAEYCAITDVDQLSALYDRGVFERPHLVLGGGSNVLFKSDYSGVVVRLATRGIRHVATHGDAVIVEAQAGENWHAFVMYCIEQGWAGLENLSLIPGTVGAAPIQNIGAYGVELQDVFDRLEAFDKQTGKQKIFQLEDCGFDYRQSVFKGELKGRYIVTSVRFRLSLTPQLHLDYGNLATAMQDAHDSGPYTIEQVSAVVSRIRQRKLPDPSTIGSAGSFFKNPIVSMAEYERVKAIAPEVVAFPMGEGRMKLAAGWLIDRAGLRGIRRGDAGTYDNQALVIVNHGAATGEELYALSEHIQQTVYDKYGIRLEREVNVV